MMTEQVGFGLKIEERPDGLVLQLDTLEQTEVDQQLFELLTW